MDRLTKRNSDGSVGINDIRYYNYDDFQKIAGKLAHYEDLTEQGRLVNEEDALKFYYIDSEDKYVVGQRLDTLYYAEVTENLELCFYMSRYLPWGEHAHCSEPREISFSEWLKGFIRKREEAEAKLAGGNNEDNL